MHGSYVGMVEDKFKKLDFKQTFYRNTEMRDPLELFCLFDIWTECAIAFSNWNIPEKLYERKFHVSKKRSHIFNKFNKSIYYLHVRTEILNKCHHFDKYLLKLKKIMVLD